MFCGNCGAQVPEGSRFCLSCGAPEPKAGNAPMSLEKKKKLKIGVTIASIVVILGILAAIFLPMLLGNKNPTDPIDHYINAYKDGNYSELQKCFPSGVLEVCLAEGSSEMEMRSLLTQRHARLVAEGMTDISYRILEVEIFDMEDLEDLRDDLTRGSLRRVIDPLKITAARSYYIEIVYGPLTSDYDRESVTVFCYGGKWYLDPGEIF